MKPYVRIVAFLTLAPGFGAALPLGAAPEAPPKPDVRLADGKELKKAIDGYRGKVVLVNLWATWCPPCVEEFPDLVKLHNTFRAKGLVVVGVSMDEPREGDKVVSFLANQKAEFPVFIRRGGDADAFFDPVDTSWSGAVPATFIFDRNGKRAGKPLIGSQSYEAFVAAVEPLLK
jgi:peroxiredoxin